MTLDVTITATNEFRGWWYSKVAEYTQRYDSRLYTTFNDIEETGCAEFRAELHKALGDSFKLVASDVDYDDVGDTKRYEYITSLYKSEQPDVAVEVFIDSDDCIVVRVYTRADHKEYGKELLDRIDKTITRAPEEPDEDNIVFFKFWYLTQDGPYGHTKELVAENYKMASHP